MSYDDYSPVDFWRGFWRWAGVGLFLAFLGGLVVLGGWKLHWWFYTQAATNQYVATNNGTAHQDTLRENIGKDFTNVTAEDVQVAKAQLAHDIGLVGQLKIEEAAQAGTLCQDAAQVSGVPLPPGQAQWVQANCQYGVLSPASKYYIPGNI